MTFGVVNEKLETKNIDDQEDLNQVYQTKKITVQKRSCDLLYRCFYLKLSHQQNNENKRRI